MLQTKFKVIIFYKDEDRVDKYLEKYKNTPQLKNLKIWVEKIISMNTLKYIV